MQTALHRGYVVSLCNAKGYHVHPDDNTILYLMSCGKEQGGCWQGRLLVRSTVHDAEL